MEAETNHDDNVDNAEILIVWESAVRPLTDAQRIVFFSLITIIVFFAVTGNILVLYVNTVSRKQKIFFRSCLISLAASDLIYSIVTSAIYLPKMFLSASELWILGPLACALFPFLQTMSVVVNSILLVCISCDRYMAIVRIVKGHWEPGKLFSLTCCVLIWAMAAGVSSPMLTLYDFQSIYITKEPPSGEGDDLYVGHLCASETNDNAYYFSIIFSFIFAPMLITFVWLNSIVAKEIYTRSRIMKEQCSSSSSSSGSSDGSKKPISLHCIRRKRQVRLFQVILVLMMVFLLCRMPSWIYTIYKLNNFSDSNVHWVLNYSFGILVLLNCALNPYLYTFMSETIRVMTLLGAILTCKKDNGFEIPS